MIITLADWQFSVDVDETRDYTMKCSQDHCLCAYCRNFYETVDLSYPQLRPVLDKFGIYLDGPCELMPFEPTLIMACYRVHGQILRFGKTKLYVNDISLSPEASDPDSFLLWVGEMELPWMQAGPMEDVISPANEPEFLERMMQKWLQTREIDQFS